MDSSYTSNPYTGIETAGVITNRIAEYPVATPLIPGQGLKPALSRTFGNYTTEVLDRADLKPLRHTLQQAGTIALFGVGREPLTYHRGHDRGKHSSSL